MGWGAVFSVHIYHTVMVSPWSSIQQPSPTRSLPEAPTCRHGHWIFFLGAFIRAPHELIGDTQTAYLKHDKPPMGSGSRAGEAKAMKNACCLPNQERNLHQKKIGTQGTAALLGQGEEEQLTQLPRNCILWNVLQLLEKENLNM